VIVDGVTRVEDGVVLGMDEHEIASQLQRIGGHYIDTIPGRNKEGKIAVEISPLSFTE